MTVPPSYPRKVVSTRMADEQDIPDLGMDDEAFDDPAFDAVRAELGDLAFLRPDDSATEPMPGDVWDRLSLALAHESAQRAAATHENVVALAPPDLAAGPRRSGPRWGSILVASSVAVIAVGLSVGVLRGSGSSSNVVAGDAVVASALTTTAPAAAAFAAPAPTAPAGGSSFDAEVLAAPQRMSFAGMVPPTRMLVDSNVDYTDDQLPQQVSTVMSTLDDPSPKATAAPTELMASAIPAGGFTATAEALRNCITKLTQAAESTVMLVDRSTFEGQDAGIVVAPEPPPSPLVRVWVVDPDCNIEKQLTIELLP
jgi:hypothetical protein